MNAPLGRQRAELPMLDIKQVRPHVWLEEYKPLIERGPRYRDEAMWKYNCYEILGPFDLGSYQMLF